MPRPSRVPLPAIVLLRLAEIDLPLLTREGHIPQKLLAPIRFVGSVSASSTEKRPPQNSPEYPHIVGPIATRPKGHHLLPKLSVAESIKSLRCRFPGSLVCTTCARLIASTPSGYKKSSLSDEQVDSYICASCRSEAQIAAETSARFHGLVPRAVLKPSLRIVAAASEPPSRRDESNMAYRGRVERWRQERAESHALLGVVTRPALDGLCLVGGRHANDSEYARECPRRNSSKSLKSAQAAMPLLAHEKSRAGSTRQQRRDSGDVSRLAGRRLRVRRQRTSLEQLAALARINAARRPRLEDAV
jgi:hypothetical protein